MSHIPIYIYINTQIPPQNQPLTPHMGHVGHLGYQGAPPWDIWGKWDA